jgi:MoaA/NifB/PqqE/SkfB family radical SAM enzyme
MATVDTLCIELTATCPLRCIHCSANAAPERKERLPAWRLAKALSEVEKLDSVYLSGGEPFEHPELESIIRAASQVAENVVVYSSGVRIGSAGNESIPEETIHAVAKAGASRIDLSFYAARAEAHDAITATPGSFMYTLETARRLRMLGLPFGIHFVPIQEAAEQILDVAELAKALKAVRMHVLAFAPQGRGRSIAAEAYPASFWQNLQELRTRNWPFTLILSSKLRLSLGMREQTPRDACRALFMDARGFLYPGEGRRQLEERSYLSLMNASRFSDLIGEMCRKD